MAWTEMFYLHQNIRQLHYGQVFQIQFVLRAVKLLQHFIKVTGLYNYIFSWYPPLKMCLCFCARRTKEKLRVLLLRELWQPKYLESKHMATEFYQTQLKSYEKVNFMVFNKSTPGNLFQPFGARYYKCIFNSWRATQQRKQWLLSEEIKDFQRNTKG